MVGRSRKTSTLGKMKTRKIRWGKEPNVTVESQEGVTKSDKESIASKGGIKEDAKVPGKAQEDSKTKKRPGL
eukprot:7214740-Ditylum_brightwellii.AAC.1